MSLQYQSTSGAVFPVTPAQLPEIEKLIANLRAEIAQRRADGYFIGYLSVPVSSKSGGNFRTNTEMAAGITDQVQKVFGKQLWLLNPAAYNLPAAPKPTGGDYMAVWSDVIAGEAGKGDVFDLVYFVGPTDVWGFFGLADTNRLDDLQEWLAKKAAADAEYKAIFDNADLRHKFLRFYGLRGSTVFSKGAHDEWNIVLELNLLRPIGEDIAVYFDGRPIEPGDYGDQIDVGYETQLR